MEIKNVIKTLERHPTKKWGQRQPHVIHEVILHQAASKGATAEAVNRYHITPTKDRDGDGVVEAWERNHITPTGAPHICFDDQTEILTEHGWKLFRDLDKQENVATLNPESHKFEWQKPTNYIEQDYKGKLLYHSTRHVEFCVTPNHKLYVSKRTTNGKYSDKWKLESAEKIQETYNRQKYRFVRTSSGFDSIDPEFIEIGTVKLKLYDYLELMAWIISEGNTEKLSNRVTITQSMKANPDNCKKIQVLLEGLTTQIPEFKWTFSHGKSFRFSNKSIADHIKEFIGVYSYNKKVPTQIKELSPEALRFFLEIIVLGDGTANGDGWVYFSTSKILLDDVQEIAIKAGLCSVVRWGIDNRDTGHFSMGKWFTFKRGSGYATITPSYKTPSLTQPLVDKEYTGKIYCVTVPNEIILVRRSGKAIFLGNCYHFVIEKDGTVKQCNEITDVTWHAKGHNIVALGILIAGYFKGPGHPNAEEPSEAQIASLKNLLNYLHAQFPKIKKTSYLGHSEVDPVNKAACPGYTIMKVLESWRSNENG